MYLKGQAMMCLAIMFYLILRKILYRNRGVLRGIFASAQVPLRTAEINQP